MTASRILVIDDELQIHRFLTPALEAAEYVTLRAETAAEGLRLAASHSPAAIILDLGLPDLDGQLVLQRLAGFSRAPVIVLSARDTEQSKVLALDAGAEDYIEKPFALAELLARLRVVLRRAATTPAIEPEELRVGPVTIDMPARLVRVQGAAAPLQLTRREWDLLVMLARHSGRVITHRQLLSAVWGPAHAGDAQYLRVYIGHLRQKLGPAAHLLRTEPGLGYRFGE
ncbi:response regulator transcription factor [Belnapia sp. T18]|uniref:Response regulator transcription factor n=1 Tax=Belnapia arida TaxID=2804533 RepID=A0ABS1UAU5_9PROT|nr:response regulator transcription factor [Belnapia arida]MBL6081235.1 response regulator transcription factor [Belnapia arida]